MSITEFATLKIKEPHTLQTELLRQHFRSQAQKQAAWSEYPLTFYSDNKDTSLVYLVSGWKDVEAHMKWIVADENQEFREIFEQFLTLEGLVHIDIDFTQIPSDTRALVCNKYIAPVEGSQGTQVIDEGGERLWAGQGIDIETHKDFYHFEAYHDDVLQEVTNTQGTEVKIMKRISFT